MRGVSAKDKIHGLGALSTRRCREGASKVGDLNLIFNTRDLLAPCNTLKNGSTVNEGLS